MQLDRTRLVLEKSQAVVSAAGLEGDVFANYLTEYILIVFYSEMEDFIQKAVFDKLHVNGNREIASFISTMARAQIKRLNKSDLADTLKTFSHAKRDKFNEVVNEAVITKYSNFITNRHKVAHPYDAVTISWSDVQEIVAVGEEILGKFQEALEANNAQD